MHSSCFIMFGLPHETEEEVMQTVQLMADAQPGRYRWTFFYPFPGTESYDLANKGGFIDSEKFASLVNFTDDSCLDFGPQQNLLLKKIAKILPWFVNAYSQLEVAQFYREKVDAIMAMDAEEWQLAHDDLLDQDKAFSARFVEQGKIHYAVKYNRFMGVISDYFANES